VAVSYPELPPGVHAGVVVVLKVLLVSIGNANHAPIKRNHPQRLHVGRLGEVVKEGLLGLKVPPGPGVAGVALF